MFDKKNYEENKVNLNYLTNKTFDNYYKYKEYTYIKDIVKNSRIISVGFDPMIAVMNDIKVIDGYHNMYPLNYKKKFRKIIEKELENNKKLKEYYDNWGSRVYAFYSNKNNLLLNFHHAKKIGASYVISKFPIENENLKAALILPDGKIDSPAFLVFENYEKILKWNRSLRFGISVCTLANMI